MMMMMMMMMMLKQCVNVSSHDGDDNFEGNE